MNFTSKNLSRQFQVDLDSHRNANSYPWFIIIPNSRYQYQIYIISLLAFINSSPLFFSLSLSFSLSHLSRFFPIRLYSLWCNSRHGHSSPALVHTRYIRVTRNLKFNNATMSCRLQLSECMYHL